MNPGTVINTLLKAASAVTDLVSTRVYPSIAPAKVIYPLIVYSELAQELRYSKEGPVGSNRHTYDIDIYGKTYLSVQNIASVVTSTLNWYSGTVNTVSVNRIWKVDQGDNVYEEEKERFHMVLTFNIELN